MGESRRVVIDQVKSGGVLSEATMPALPCTELHLGKKQAASDFNEGEHVHTLLPWGNQGPVGDNSELHC